MNDAPDKVPLILVVDDEEKIRKLLKLVLEDYTVYAAETAPDAMQMLRAGDFDLVISDIKMPGESGLQLLQKINEEDEGLPVILITGHADKNIAIEAIRHGAFDFIEKPFDTNALLVSVERGIKQRSLYLKYESAMSALRRRTVELDDLSRQLSVIELEGQTAAPAREVIHEVLNPVSIISGHAERARNAIEAEPVDKEVALKSIDAIDRMIHRIKKITEGIRALSRGIESDPSAPAKISDLIKDTAQLTREKIKSTGAQIRIPQKIPNVTLQCRAVQITQVLSNLVNNALDAIGDVEDKWLSIEVQDLGDTVTVSVTDSGKGISESDCQNIFTAFFTTKKECNGTGLGLSICKKIVESHGGDLTLDQECANTRFVVELPKGEKS